MVNKQLKDKVRSVMNRILVSMRKLGNQNVGIIMSMELKSV